MLCRIRCPNSVDECVQQQFEEIAGSPEVVGADRASLIRRETAKHVKEVGQLGAEAFVEDCSLREFVGGQCPRIISFRRAVIEPGTPHQFSNFGAL
jgi:hypothetical protein